MPDTSWVVRMGPEAATLAPQPLRPGFDFKVTNGQAGISSRGKNIMDEDPVADVLEWLGSYDFRETSQASAAKSTEHALGDDVDNDETMPTTDAATAQLPRTAAANRSRGPGRLLQPTGQKGSSVANAAPGSVASVTSAAVAAQSPSRSTNDSSLQKTQMSPPGAMGRCADRSPTASAWCKSTDAGKDDKASGERDFFEEEEEEWDLRQQKSGTVGRLVVYHAGDNPREDVVLRGGGRRHIVVAGIREGGQAARVGVRAGDRLVSIDGKKDFLGQSADDVRERLEGPAVLVFLGFVGKLQAEVRLTCQDHVCGISTRQEVVKGSSDAPLTLCEERVINAGFASLFLTVAEKEAEGDTGLEGKAQQQLPMFELQHKEAHSLVKRALRRLEAKEVLSKATPGQAPNDRPSAAFAASTSSPQPQSNGPQSPMMNFEGHGKSSGALMANNVANTPMAASPESLRSADDAGGLFAPRGLLLTSDGERSPFTPVYNGQMVQSYSSAAAAAMNTTNANPELHHVI